MKHQLKYNFKDIKYKIQNKMILKQLLKNKIKHITILLTFILILPMLGCGNDDSESVVVATEESELDKYTPFLNGHIELNKGYEVQGWMVFDIPRSIKPLTIWWRESDDIVIDLPK